MTTEFARLLRQRLREPLPGRAAQRRFGHEISYGRHFGPVPSTAKPAAVLVLLAPLEPWAAEGSRDWPPPLSLVLTRRQASLSAHGGQVSFPGGRRDPGETAEETALRETQEELGLAPELVDLCGRLSPLFTYASNFMVQPIVGLLRTPAEFCPNSAEVARVLSIPVGRLLDESCVESRLLRRSNCIFEVRGFCYDSELVWGSTAMILGEFLEVVRPLWSR